MSVPDIRTTFGALLLGGLFTSVLAGISNLQAAIYYRAYGKDPTRVKGLVFGVWLLDNVHTAFIWGGLWYYFIGNYGQPDKIDYIPWCMALTVILTALITVLVHCFLLHRIFLLSNRNWYMTVPVVRANWSPDFQLISACCIP
ncbi:hypothetical protein B0H19DRAFT_1268627 [Mycena capillaripes]|nr:hypothetical protein B0H19DRAFT_1268627 [Mycena capillaripes]